MEIHKEYFSNRRFITLNENQTIDGINLNVGDKILLIYPFGNNIKYYDLRKTSDKRRFVNDIIVILQETINKEVKQYAVIHKWQALEPYQIANLFYKYYDEDTQVTELTKFQKCYNFLYNN